MLPWLFNVLKDGEMRKGRNRSHGIVILLSITTEHTLLFADDTVMVTGKKDDMQSDLHEVKKVTDK